MTVSVQFVALFKEDKCGKQYVADRKLEKCNKYTVLIKAFALNENDLDGQSDSPLDQLT
jgi:hypothetical protein